MLDPQVIVISLATVILLTVFLSVIAIAEAFTAGKTSMRNEKPTDTIQNINR